MTRGVRASAPPTSILRRYLSHSGPVTRAAILDRYGFDEAWLDEVLQGLVEAREIARGRITPNAAEEEFCDRRSLERIHRRTLTLLRKEIQAVPAAAYAEFLARWQHAKPDERRFGRDGLREVLDQLRGLELPGLAWEQDVLPARLRDYRPVDLDALCESGDLVWVGSGKDPRRGRVRFFARGEGGLFVGQADDAELSARARAAYDFLKSEGASFVADIQAASGLNATECQGALTELVMAGLVTNDAMGALRSMLAGTAAETSAAPRSAPSALEAELDERFGRKRAAATAFVGAHARGAAPGDWSA